MHPLRMAAIVVAFAFASNACAQAPAVPKTNVTTDLTDVWWPDAEPGWGIQFVHNADIVFATLYVYNASGQPTFYVAALQNTPVGGGTWTGTLYSSTGTHFAAPWNTAAAAETPVGTMSFSLTGIGAGTLVYNVGAAEVAKTLKRQPLRLENNSDEYNALTSFTGFSGAGCGLDDFPPDSVTQVAIYQVGGTAALTLTGWTDGKAGTCTVNPAAYSQVGRLGQYQGTLTCPGGRTASLLLYDIANRVKMLSGRYTMVWDDGCQITGRFSAIAVGG